MSRGTRAGREERLARLAQMRLWAGSDNAPYGYVTAAQAARTLGGTARTVERDKAELRRREEQQAARAAPTRAYTTRERARTSDVPRNCWCTWRYHWGTSRWVRTAGFPGCPWHAQRRAAS